LAIRLIFGESITTKPAPPPRPAAPHAAVPASKDAGFWYIGAPAHPFRLIRDAGANLGKAYRPTLAVDRTSEWLTGGADQVKVAADRLVLEAGEAGNFLITRRSDYGPCTLNAVVVLEEGSEAYLALRAHRGARGWRGITSKIVTENDSVRAGFQSFNFQARERGKIHSEGRIGEPLPLRFALDQAGLARVYVGNQETSVASYENQEVLEAPGAAGLFVKSGRVLIESLEIIEN
jgi:hypothetical protein